MPIFDQGYQHWNGTRSGHGWRWLAIARHGVRVGFKSKILRLILFLSWAPALVLAGALCLWGLLENKSSGVEQIMQFLMFVNPQMIAEPQQYRLEVWTLCFHYFLLTELEFSMVLVLLVGPGLISQDLRFNALPLYFSRPLRRIDYFLGKLGVVAFFLAMVTIVPCVVAYVLGVCFSLDAAVIGQTLVLLLRSVAYGVVITLSAGLLILALSALSRNSRYVALFWIGLWLMSSISATVLESIHREEEFRTYVRANTGLPQSMNFSEQRKFWRRHREQMDAWQLEMSRSDWRPLVSYTENISRVGRSLLGVDAAWERISELLPEENRTHFLLDYSGPGYPAYWSGLVLMGIFGLSAWVLNSSVKSLDRLK